VSYVSAVAPANVRFDEPGQIQILAPKIMTRAPSSFARFPCLRQVPSRRRHRMHRWWIM
jgi:hypothetical protein